MSYRPDLRIFAGNDDITDDVVALDYGHGVDIITSKLGYSRVESGGEMILDNDADQYDAAALDALGVLELRHETDVLCRFLVLDYDFNRRDEIVRCTLATSNPDAYRGEVMINAGSVPGAGGMSLTMTQVVSSAGVTITPETPWAAELIMDQGTVYDTTVNQFLTDLEVAGDGFVYEDHLGQLRFLGWDDARPHTVQFTPADFWIEDDTAESYLRRAWRRDAQIVNTLDITYISDGGTFDAEERLNSLGYWQTFPGVGHVRLLHMTPLRQVGGITYSEDVDRFAWHSEIDGTIHVTNRAPPFTGPFPTDWSITSVGAPYINPDVPGEVLVRVQLQGSARDWNSLWLTQRYRITSQMYPTSFTQNEYRLLARDDGQTVLGLLRKFPWPVDDSALDTVGARLTGWADRIPRVTKLCFPLIQQTEARFDALKAHRIGSISTMDIRLDGLDIAGFMANLMVRWRYQRGGYSCVEMHFLELRAHATQRPLFAKDDYQLFPGQDEGALYVE